MEVAIPVPIQVIARMEVLDHLEEAAHQEVVEEAHQEVVEEVHQDSVVEIHQEVHQEVAEEALEVRIPLQGGTHREVEVPDLPRLVQGLVITVVVPHLQILLPLSAVAVHQRPHLMQVHYLNMADM